MSKALIAAVVVLELTALFQLSTAQASAPTCSTSGGIGYCNYGGVVARAYINIGNLMLIYFDTPVSPASLSAVGITGVSYYDACAFLTTENPEYAKMFFAAALTAQARGAAVTIQLRGTAAGYLKCDRIWVYE